MRQHGIELVDFDSLLAQSDYLSIHCPLNADTRGRFDKSAFAKMKTTCVLINAARGGIVVESDLIEALKSGNLRGAGLDCLEEEPPSPNNPLFQMDHVVFTPHVASADYRSQEDMGIEAADCIIKLHTGEWPTAAVVNNDPDVGNRNLAAM